MNYYNPTYQPQQGIVWVQGEAGAKSYPVASGNSVLLMDSEESLFYIKSTDQSGFPQPLRVFEYKEKSEVPQIQYVTKDEFDKAMAEIKRSKKNE